MTCPKCNEGEIIKITFKRTGNSAFFCNFCETVWFGGEEIDIDTGHALDAYTQSEGHEYTIEGAEEKDQEHQPAEYKDYK